MNTDEIQGALVATLSPDVTVRRQAEAYLDNCRRTAGFPVLLLQLVRPFLRRADDAFEPATPLFRVGAAALRRVADGAVARAPVVGGDG